MHKQQGTSPVCNKQGKYRPVVRRGATRGQRRGRRRRQTASGGDSNVCHPLYCQRSCSICPRLWGIRPVSLHVLGHPRRITVVIHSSRLFFTKKTHLGFIGSYMPIFRLYSFKFVFMALKPKINYRRDHKLELGNPSQLDLWLWWATH